MSWLSSILSKRSRKAAPSSLPDPSLPPSRRGSWSEAALTNTDITEVVKREIGSTTSPWQR